MSLVRTSKGGSAVKTSELPRGTETIVVVEDFDKVREIVVKDLQRLGYTVYDAGTGAEALRIADTIPGQLDLLLTDLYLPDLDGREIARRLRESRSELKVVLTTGQSRRVSETIQDIEEGLALLMKPFDREELAFKVRQVLDGELGGGERAGE